MFVFNFMLTDRPNPIRGQAAVFLPYGEMITAPKIVRHPFGHVYAVCKTGSGNFTAEQVKRMRGFIRYLQDGGRFMVYINLARGLAELSPYGPITSYLAPPDSAFRIPDVVSTFDPETMDEVLPGQARPTMHAV
jgi:hypothetical protein